MFDDDDRRLVQVASIANAIGAAENAAPGRGLLWLAGEVEAGTLAARLFIPVRMRTVDTTRASPAESLGAWRSMAKRVRAALVDPNLKLDKRDSYLPSAASTWHVHVNDLLQFIGAAEMHDAVRAELRELAQRYRGAVDVIAAPAVQVVPASADAAATRLLTNAPRETMVPAVAAKTQAPDGGGATGKVEAVASRQDRRLSRLITLGDDMRAVGDGWQTVKRCGALARLVQEERSFGRPMCDKTNVRDDLAAAAQRRQDRSPH